MNRQQVWPYFFLSLPLLILFLVGWQLSHFSASNRPKGGVGEEGSTIQDLRIWHYQGERIAWTLEAPKAISHLDGTIDVEQPRLLLLSSRGEETRLRAGSGWVSQQGDLTIFRENVIMEDNRQRRLTTQDLRYQPELGILSSMESFQWQDKEVTLQGTGFRMDQKDRKLRVMQGVQANFGDVFTTGK
ncbi:MAG: LPS export ABC transporter periplasmic protein LptC [Magnetococcales bacterium]|nr:LPS export ABC transporter periplasmic protein LptC [Magnetococcales bacterium]NGZ26788.1 LPS export ABC transporter periplasmic protein LptC [Magnetococcales bacterium]